MSKNMTRKGLAFGAGLALIGSVVVALPAQANGTITLNPDAGSSFNTLSSSTFTLMPVMAGVASGDYKYLRYLVSNVDEKSFRFDIRQGNNSDGEVSYQTGTASTAATQHEFTTTNIEGTDGGGGGATADTFTITSTAAQLAFLQVGDVININTATASADLATGTIVATGDWNAAGEVKIVGSTLVYLKAGATISANVTSTAEAGTITLSEVVKDDSFVVIPDDLTTPGANLAAIGGQNYLDLAPVTINATTSVVVTAWIDGNQNNKIDSGEIASTAQTVTFKHVSSLSATVSIDAVYASATSVTAAVSLTGDINYEQIDSGDVTITLTETTDGSGAALAGNTADTAVAWDSTKKRFQATDSGLTNIGSGDVLKVIAEVDNDYDLTVDDTKAEATKTVATTTSNPTYRGIVVGSATAVTTTKAEDDPNTDGTGFADGQAGVAYALEGSAGFTFKLFIGTDVATPVGIASAPVKVAVTGGTITATDLVTVGGKALVSGTTTNVDVVTDATGYATVAVVLGAADDDDTITFDVQPYGSSVSANMVVTVTDNAGDYVLTQVTPGSPSIKAGDKLEIAYRVVDKFGAAPANNSHSLLIVPTTNERTKAADWAYSVPVVDGLARLSVTDNGTGTGKFTANAKLVANADTTTAISTVDVVVNVVADPAVATLTLEKLTYGTAQASDANNDGDFADTGDTDNTGALLVESKTFANYDDRYNAPTVDAPEVRDTYKVVVGAKATNAAAAAVVGAPVTFSAAGMLFKNGDTYSKDSITVHAGSTGIASVEVWSSVGGAREVKITSGTATATQKLTFAAGTGSAGSFTVTAPATAPSGSTSDVVVKVLDSLGNPAKGVTVTLFSTGPGYLINTTGTTLTDGTFSTKLLIGSNDSGNAVVSAVVTIAGVETIKTASISVGTATAEAKIGSFAGRVAVRVENAKGSTISVKIGRSWYKYTATSANYLKSWKSTKGSTQVVTVYVDGELQNTATITVK